MWTVGSPMARPFGTASARRIDLDAEPQHRVPVGEPDADRRLAPDRLGERVGAGPYDLAGLAVARVVRE